MAVTMAEITKLRKMTGAGMMDCKNALNEANGDFDGAIKIIREKGQAVAAKRSDRDASEGCVLVKAVDYLSIRDHSIKQLSDKLYRCGYEQEEIETAVNKLLQNGYLNDTDLCRRQITRYLNENRYSIMAIKHKTKEVYGVQFHPESYFTDYGKEILKNFISISYNQEEYSC